MPSLLPVLGIFSSFASFCIANEHRLHNSGSQLGTIEYNEVSICETTPGVDSYSGYVHLPASVIPDLQGNTPFNISTFFWYFAARNNPEDAPLAIYLAGGPGDASTFAPLEENGPCYANKDGNSTTLNPWSFNNNVNMLYIDQPSHVGFSYDEIIDGTFSVLDGVIYNQSLPNNQTMISGRFPSQNPETTANTTTLAASALWHFSQVFLSEFKEYSGPKDTISIWGNSYGGYYTVGTFVYFQDQNEKIANGTLDCETYRTIHLDTLGITNGCIDVEISGASYVTLPFNNTYDVQIFNETVYEAGLEAFYGPGGCVELSRKCRALQILKDPGSIGNNEEVNAACGNATAFCFENVLNPYKMTGHSDFDMASPTNDPFPPRYPSSFLNQDWVKQALGIPDGLNHTQVSMSVANNFFGTGDFIVRTVDSLNSLLEHGVKVVMVYGDRDWKCSWTGAENVSLSASYKDAASFRDAGYEEIQTNASYVGGVVRQYEGFSFSRVFEAGHAVSYSQPETVYQIFNRAMFSNDVATGQKDTSEGTRFQTSGPGDAWGWKNAMPPMPETECSLWDAVSCSEAQLAALGNGTATVENWIVVDPAV
ncbi:alpha/beta-hydrolase [Polyplosphaeria fusca]|uniref:Alpha/beta-hydrolase n=1 Tax=Polyplosphaeria fusca TaxID=682080 RepID=A0A9P4R160_9PLEO|nr:alpha/beta-hydrolase [Polyplosphaeria fusca]